MHSISVASCKIETIVTATVTLHNFLRMRLGTSKPCLPTYSCHTDYEAIGQTEHGKRRIRTSTLVPMMQERYWEGNWYSKAC